MKQATLYTIGRLLYRNLKIEFHIALTRLQIWRLKRDRSSAP